ncbi:MAG: hypothetical protein RIC87_01930 [Kiloniellales bacterium]
MPRKPEMMTPMPRLEAGPQGKVFIGRSTERKTQTRANVNLPWCYLFEVPLRHVLVDLQRRHILSPKPALSKSVPQRKQSRALGTSALACLDGFSS